MSFLKKPTPGDIRIAKCRQCDDGILTRAINYSMGNGFSIRDKEPTTCPYCDGTKRVKEQFQGDGSGGFWAYLGPSTDE